MKRLRAFKYYSPLLLYVTAYVAFTQRGVLTFLPLAYSFLFIPVLELFLRPDPANLSETEEAIVKKDPAYDLILYMVAGLQLVALYWFFQALQEPTLTRTELAGRIISMGLLCGVFGINVGHELGHRIHKADQRLAKVLLLTSLYMHFFIEHNKGHHKHVATPQDPSSAHWGESVYLFWPRTILNSYRSAWRIANEEVRKKGHAVGSIHNEMLQLQLIQLLFLSVIYIYFGTFLLCCFLGAAALGILMLETVNYIEHYGLSRKQLENGKYERALPEHSWNSDHVIGRLMLFELSRHSDHHYLASRKYPLLRHHNQAPQMPTGYPGMMILSLLPPLWFSVMHRRIAAFHSTTAAA